MAELSKLTIDLTFNDKGLHEFEDEGTRVAESLNKSYSDLDGTFVMLAKDMSEFQQALNKLNGNKLTLNSSFIQVAKTIGESYDLSVLFGQSLDDVVKKLSSVKPIVEETNNSLENTSSKFPDFRPLISLLTEVAKFYRSTESFIKIFITFFDVFRVFADVAIREFGSKLTALFISIKDSLKTGFNQFLEFLDRVKEFGKLKFDQFSEFVNQLREAGRLKFDQISNSLKSFTDDIVKFAGEFFKNAPGIRQLIILFERLSSLRIPPQIAIPLAIADCDTYDHLADKTLGRTRRNNRANPRSHIKNQRGNKPPYTNKHCIHERRINGIGTNSLRRLGRRQGEGIGGMGRNKRSGIGSC